MATNNKGYLQDKNGNKLYPDYKEVYSTSEQVIGKWVDGKPLYQKSNSMWKYD